MMSWWRMIIHLNRIRILRNKKNCCSRVGVLRRRQRISLWEGINWAQLRWRKNRILFNHHRRSLLHRKCRNLRFSFLVIIRLRLPSEQRCWVQPHRRGQRKNGSWLHKLSNCQTIFCLNLYLSAKIQIRHLYRSQLPSRWIRNKIIRILQEKRHKKCIRKRIRFHLQNNRRRWFIHQEEQMILLNIRALNRQLHRVLCKDSRSTSE